MDNLFPREAKVPSDGVSTNDSYDGAMDKECIAICDALNNLPHVETMESCCGHLKEPYRIWFKTTDIYSLGVIARTFSNRYLGTNNNYIIKVESKDAGDAPMYWYLIESEKPYSNQKDMDEDINIILEDIKHWTHPSHFYYFCNGEKDTRNSWTP